MKWEMSEKKKRKGYERYLMKFQTYECYMYLTKTSNEVNEINPKFLTTIIKI